MVGVGVVLPLIGFAAQAHSLELFPWWVLLLLLPLQYACAITTALPDEPSDRQSKKRTMPVLIGGTTARVAVVVFNIVVAGTYSAIFFSPWVAVAWFGVALQLGTITRALPGSVAINIFAFASILTNLALVASETIRVLT
jgi:1,4-dihydroxy-2-naphthoate octaprenyltransferase